jgi:hypothetical protein
MEDGMAIRLDEALRWALARLRAQPTDKAGWADLPQQVNLASVTTLRSLGLIETLQAVTGAPFVRLTQAGLAVLAAGPAPCPALATELSA